MTSIPATPEAFRRSLTDRLRRQAGAGNSRHQQLRRQFLLQRFLARVFADPNGPWVLKGGTGLLVRLPGARHSKDVDLLHTDSNIEVAVDELQQLVQEEGSDHFTFVLGSPIAMTGVVSGVQVPVQAYLGGARFDNFTVDLSTELHVVACFERTRPVSVVDFPGLPQLPEFVLYPLPDQVADKVCAMYERHGDRRISSTRYRDLVDLLLITAHFPLDAALTVDALTTESRRRKLDLPTAMIEPDHEWERGYPRIARESGIDSDLHDLQAALTRAGLCLDPLLVGEVTAGAWNPANRVWNV